ncbi:MAG: tetratricopeptide repeat protein [Bacteroidales bacterium]|nr:tetratricopeptide repeat protein [Candidatus Colicola faecequi]
MQKTLRNIFATAFCAFLFVQFADAQMNTDRLTAIGRNALYFDDYVVSIQYFNQVIKLKPYLAEPYLYRAIAKIQLGDLNGAEADCNNALKNSPFLVGAYYTRGFVYRQMEKYDKAEQDFSEALNFVPENKTYLALRADVRARKKDYDGALEDIDFLIRKEPEGASCIFEKGAILLEKKDTLSALDCFSKATKLDSQNASCWSAKGVVNSMLGREDEALFDLTQSINLGSTWAGDFINRGILYYRKHNFRAALADYDKAIEISPRDPHIYYNRGLLREELGDYNNALADLDRSLELDPDNTEVHYQRGMVNLRLNQWKAAISDFDAMIERYPYFLPSYYLAAQAKTSLGDKKGAFIYRQKAADLEKDKEKILAAQKVNTDVQSADAQPQKKDRRKEFSSHAAQNQGELEATDKYASIARGAVQKRDADVINMPNIVLSYYAQKDPVRTNAYYHYLVDDYNRLGILPSPLRFTLQEISLTAEMVNRHFEEISKLSQVIDKLRGEDLSKKSPAEKLRYSHLFFSRAVEFALVQDYTSAIEDASYSLLLSDNPIVYFCRANWRFKLLEYQRSNGDEISADYLKLEFEMILRDYDQVMLNQPDFAFAAYNKANMLCTQKDFKAAIQHYTTAIEADPDFAEAWFNRGLTYIFTDELQRGLNDLSKAGELGMYQAYNIIAKMQ